MKTLYQIVGQVNIRILEGAHWRNFPFAANQLIWAGGQLEAERAYRKHTNAIYNAHRDTIEISYYIQANEVLDAEKILC